MIKAVGDKIIVQELKKEKSKGGLIIPESVHMPQAFGRVMSVGDEVSGIEIDMVLVFHSNGGMAMAVEGKILRCLMVNEVYGIVESDEILETLTLCEVKQSDLDKLDKSIKAASQQAEPKRIVTV